MTGSLAKLYPNQKTINQNPIPMNKYHIPLLPGRYYHIYNHAVGYDNLFREPQNYYFFLDKFKQFLDGWLTIYTFCLLPNHFHLLVKMNDIENNEPDTILSDNINMLYSEMVSKQFNRLFKSYSQSYNKFYKRRGSLFMQNFKRIEVDTDDYFVTLVLYIHFNPINHGMTKDLEDWEFSSYSEILYPEPGNISSVKVIDWFGDEVTFKKMHERNLFLHTTDELDYF